MFANLWKNRNTLFTLVLRPFSSHVSYLVAYPLHAMSSWCLWPIHIIRLLISYFQVLLQGILKPQCISDSGTSFNCQLSCYTMECIYFLNGFKSSKVWRRKRATKQHAAARYAGAMDGLLKQLFLLTNFTRVSKKLFPFWHDGVLCVN